MPSFATSSKPYWLARLAVMTVGLSTPISLLADAGDLDCTFGSGGIATLDLGAVATSDAELQTDGKIVTMSSTSGSIRLSRILAGGDFDPTFGTGGTTTFALDDSLARELTIDSLGRFVVAGGILNGGDSEVLVARFTSTGAVDTSFGGGDGWTSFDWTAATATAGLDSGDAIAVDSSDRPVVGGSTDANGASINPSDRNMAVARLTIDGALDPTFGSGGIALASSPGGHDDALSTLQIDSAGRIVAIGGTAYPFQVSNPIETMLARWTSDGMLDTVFDGDGILILDSSGIGGGDRGIDLDFDSTGRILALSLGADPLVARLTESGVLDTTFSGDGLAQQSFLAGQDQVARILVQADDKPLVIGFPRVGGPFHYASMRFTTSGDLDTSWGTTGVVTTTIGLEKVAHAAILQPDQRLIIAGQNTGGSRILARYLNDGSTDNTTVTTVTSDLPDPSAPGVSVSVSVLVTANSGVLPPTGTVAVGDGVDACSLGLTPDRGATASGSCALSLSTVGNRTLTASYQGDVSFCGSSDTEPHLVTPTATTTSIIGDTPDPSVIGQAVTISYSVASSAPGSPSGNVTVTDGIDSCVDTVAAGSCTLVFTTAGARLLEATYSGDATFAGSSSVLEPHQVNAASTTTTIISDTPDPSVVGQPITVAFDVAITAPGTGTPTGNVTVTDGIDSCTATVAGRSCTVILTTVGPRSLTANYTGDASFNGSASAAEPHQVNAAETTTTITSDSPDPSAVGQTVAVTFAVDVTAPGMGTPTGNVTVTDGVDSCTATVADGSCNLTLTTVGPRLLTATYAGNASFNGSVSAAEAHQVNAAETSTTITSDSPDPSAVGQTVTVAFNVAVTAPGTGTPTGDVTVTDGVDSCTTTVADGSCNLTLSTVGTRSLTATYAGDASFNGSASTTEPHQVNAAETSTTITSDSPDPSVVGQPVTVAFNVAVTAPGTGTPTGDVTVTDGVDSCTETVADGSCTVTLTTVGPRSLTATYAGNSSFSGSASAAEPHQVNAAETTTTITSDNPDPSAVGQPVTVAFAVAITAPGTGTPTGNVTVTDGVDSCAATVADGSCTLTLNTVGPHSLTAS